MRYFSDVSVIPAVTQAPNISPIWGYSASHLVSHHIFQANSKNLQTLPFFSILIILSLNDVPIISFPGYSANLFYTQNLSPPIYSLNATKSLQNLSQSQNILAAHTIKFRECKSEPSVGHALPLGLDSLRETPWCCSNIGLGLWSLLDQRWTCVMHCPMGKNGSQKVDCTRGRFQLDIKNIFEGSRTI